MEEWKDVNGYPGYSVSSYGRVRSIKDFHGGLNSKPHLLKQRINPNGYAIVTLYNSDNKPRQLSVHRLVAEHYIPNNDRLPFVDHLDGNKINNDVANLEWVNPSENSFRAVRNGLYEPVFRKTRKPIIVTDLRTGEETYFESVNQAARDLNVSPAIISRAANMEVEKVKHYVIEPAGPEERLLYT